SKMIYSKEYEIVKNIVEISKRLSANNQFSYSLHKLSILFFSELFRFFRINPKMKKKGEENEQKNEIILQTIAELQENGGFIIEADIVDLDNDNNLGPSPNN